MQTNTVQTNTMQTQRTLKPAQTARPDVTIRRKTASRLWYFAYGSNLDQEQMAWRCPLARPVGRLTLTDWALEFRGVATIVPCPGKSVDGAVYAVTPADERALDLYEGYRRSAPQSGLYRREYLSAVDRAGELHPLMFYVMNREKVSAPSGGYLATIRQGFQDWGLSPRSLEEAVIASYEAAEQRNEEAEQRNEEAEQRDEEAEQRDEGAHGQLAFGDDPFFYHFGDDIE